MKRHFEWVRDRKKVFGKARKWRKSWVKLTTWAEKIIVKKSFDQQLRGVVKNKQIFYCQVNSKGCTSQKYSTKFESNKQTDSKIFTPKGHRNMKRKVKMYSITGVGISDDGLT